ncbi:GDSL-type esterase/lipase family protein [Sporosarcina thermotolerans]|uniref:GDSL-type esterase/lipase family protein n=1 Tax=Sporosarcina thermotolerans TaxID=633404 RepID=A0AAW9ACL1_9BACL|nr:GDSL-type esterase/lipase family protein [Sporosarcina thermotolerans]MDW0116838.1 GDSL-type esterase/lipase family protein [Sporosarcina thermotolerans]WHT49011.1 GDSL-type esterase/lipase family protein [Sporosarcina thermotolerans]
MKIALIGDSLTEGRPGVSFANMLKVRFPKDLFVNLGKPGETVKSLYSRLTKTGLDSDFDLAFVWIGTNDVYSKLLSVKAQPVVKDFEEFREVYQQLVEIVISSSKMVVLVSPALVGEHFDNPSNKEVRELCTLVKSLSEKVHVHYLDFHAVFEKALANEDSSDYISTNPFRVMFDVFFYKNEDRIDQLSNRRGLKLTLDGLHLNSAGAKIVSDEYAHVISNAISPTILKGS